MPRPKLRAGQKVLTREHMEKVAWSGLGVGLGLGLGLGLGFESGVWDRARARGGAKDRMSVRAWAWVSRLTSPICEGACGEGEIAADGGSHTIADG